MGVLGEDSITHSGPTTSDDDDTVLVAALSSRSAAAIANPSAIATAIATPVSMIRLDIVLYILICV
jgi:hypothetical protein